MRWCGTLPTSSPRRGSPGSTATRRGCSRANASRRWRRTPSAAATTPSPTPHASTRSASPRSLRSPSFPSRRAPARRPACPPRPRPRPYGRQPQDGPTVRGSAATRRRSAETSTRLNGMCAFGTQGPLPTPEGRRNPRAGVLRPAPRRCRPTPYRCVRSAAPAETKGRCSNRSEHTLTPPTLALPLRRRDSRRSRRPPRRRGRARRLSGRRRSRGESRRRPPPPTPFGAPTPTTRRRISSPRTRSASAASSTRGPTPSSQTSRCAAEAPPRCSLRRVMQRATTRGYRCRRWARRMCGRTSVSVQ